VETAASALVDLTDALDGNALAGLLLAAFGEDITTATGVCANCSTRSRVAEFAVYSQAPGAVVRCRHCSSVAMVLVEAHGINRLDLMGLAALEHSP
jgi:hypothetical protein